MVRVVAEVILTPGSDENEPIGRLTKIKKTELDFKYPHRCFECGKELRWLEVTEATSNGFRIEYLKKLWKSKYVQFYCCKCFIVIIKEGLKRPPIDPESGRFFK